MVWRYNLGDKVAEIESSRSDYNDGMWHQVIASRSGREGYLVVRTHERKDDVTEGSTEGQFKQLELAPQATKIYAAGVPDNFSLPGEVINSEFRGGLDDFSYSENQIPLGLWNFVDGTANDEGNNSFLMAEFLHSGVLLLLESLHSLGAFADWTLSLIIHQIFPLIR